MHAWVFNLKSKSMFSLEAGEHSRYGHVFGGPPRHTGVEIPKTTFRARLHYNLNLHDPKLGLGTAKRNWLPLYWFPYQFDYRVVSDTKIEILSQPDPEIDSEYFTPELPEFPVGVSDFPYDPKDPDDAYVFAGVFGLDKLFPKAKRKVERQIRDEYEEHFEDPPDVTLNELLFYQGGNPFVQGVPCSPCPNPKCKNSQSKPKTDYRSNSALLIQLTPDEDADSRIYDELAGSDMGQLIYQVCKTCLSVRAYNSCT